MSRPHVAVAGPAQTEAMAADLSGSADYHQVLFDQNPNLDLSFHSFTRRGHPTEVPRTTRPSSSTRQWISTTPTRPDTGNTARKQGKKDTGTRPSHGCLTPAEVVEFEALPVAVRRKYFSTLERLRFAQTSGLLEPGTNDGFDNNIHPKLYPEVKPSPKHSFRRSRQRKTESRDIANSPLPPATYRQNYAVSADCLPSAALSPRQKRVHLPREHQVVLARQLRESVILDAADEAIYRIGRRASRQLSSHLPTPTLSSGRPSMESQGSTKRHSKAAGTRDDLYDSFRWLDEEEDLDLRLILDDYHANLRETLPSPTKDHRPSFRRHLSITKIPFGRSSVSSSRPVTKDVTSTPASPTPTSASHPPHKRRKSRALSLVTPRHTVQTSSSSIDPAAAHYQDPEARLKLRVYLASAQKFDEAIEFGFPSNDAMPAGSSIDMQGVRHHHPRRGLSDDSGRLKTFLSDDNSSTYSEDLSLPDSDSPKTPHTPEKHAVKPHHLPTDDSTNSPKGSEGFAHAPAASREMTLRMTLTRPDLRACEDQIYGWQKGAQQPLQQGRPSQSFPPQDEAPANALYIGDTKPKDSLEKFFASLDEETTPSTAADGGVMKRFWNRVRRN